MPRRVEDIIPGQNRRSIRSVPVKNKESDNNSASKTRATAKRITRTKTDSELKEIEKDKKTEEKIIELSQYKHSAKSDEEKVVETEPIVHKKRRKKTTSKLPIITLGVAVIVAGIGFIASKYYSKAVFTIVPKKAEIVVDNVIIAKYTNSSNENIAGILTYEINSFSDFASTTVPAIDGTSLSTKAQGKVTIYNNYSTTTQRLVAGTRLSESSGKIYRLLSSVTVPGKNSQGQAGKIIASVIADQVGAEYNLSKAIGADFKIVGYKGTPKYDGFYAKLYTDITGGYKGVKKTVSPTVLASSTNALKLKLTEMLKNKIASKTGDEYIQYDNLYTINFGNPIISGDSKNTATITLNGTIYSVLLKKSKFISRLSDAQTISSFKNYRYESRDLESLAVSIANTKDFLPAQKSDLFIKVKGKFSLVGIVPIEDIRAKLMGQKSIETKEILKSFGAVIESVDGSISPSWATVPGDPNRVHIIIKDDNK